MNYPKQRKTIEEYRNAAFEEKDNRLAQEFSDIMESITKAERFDRALQEILFCAQKNREFCLHCDSVAKLIEELRK